MGLVLVELSLFSLVELVDRPSVEPFDRPSVGSLEGLPLISPIVLSAEPFGKMSFEVTKFIGSKEWVVRYGA